MTGGGRFILTSEQKPSIPAALALEYTAPTAEVHFDPEDVDDFLRALRNSKRELELARQQFETVTDPLLVDHVVFRLGAAERHFNYLFQLARKMNLSVDGVRWEWFAED
jgi:hypothetical protein